MCRGQAGRCRCPFKIPFSNYMREFTMLHRYCLEVDSKGRRFIIHTQKCREISVAELTPQGRLADLGPHADPLAAHREAAALLSGQWTRGVCPCTSHSAVWMAA